MDDASMGNIYAVAVQPDGEIAIAAELFTFQFPFELPDHCLKPSGELVSDLHFDKLARLPDGQVHGALRGQFGGGFVIQASSDFVNWLTVTTNATPNSRLNFIDSQGSAFTERFYQCAPGRDLIVRPGMREFHSRLCRYHSYSRADRLFFVVTPSSLFTEVLNSSIEEQAR